jgi:uncharacterized protein
MSDRFVVTITHAADDADKATVGMVIANAAAASGKETLVFLSNEGVRLAAVGFGTSIHQDGFAPMSELLTNFAAAGGTLLVCTPCAKVRNLADGPFVDGAKLGGGAGLVEFMTAQGAVASVSY